MNAEFVDAVCKLVDAVIVGHCTIAGSEAYDTEERIVDCALTVVEKIRTAQEFSSLHGWAEHQLSAARAPEAA
jgi:hypothetical protein